MNLVISKRENKELKEIVLEKNRTSKQIEKTLNLYATHYRFVLEEGGKIHRSRAKLMITTKGEVIVIKGV